MRYYDSADEVRRRLVNGIVLYKGEPVIVVEVASIKSKKSKFGVHLRNLPGNEKSWKVALDDPELNYRQIRLGFINTENDVYRVIRYPLRSSIQALNDHSCFLEPLQENRSRNVLRPREESATNVIRRDQAAIDSLAGRFPSLEEARRAVEGGARAKAFSYDWAYQRVMGVPALWYKTQAVGITIDPKSILRLEADLQYLKEPLQELGIKVAQ